MSKMKNIWNGNEPVFNAVYGPVGSDNRLQKEITTLMHNLVKLDGRYTLAEMGYFHMNTTMFSNDRVEMKLYFHPELAMVATPMMNGKHRYDPSPMLDVFKGYLFIGNIDDSLGYDTVTVPKYRIETDKLGRPALNIRSTKKTEDDEEVLVLYCSVPLVIAAINGIPLSDPNYELKFESIAAPGKKKSTNEIIATVGRDQEFPINLHVSWSDNSGYDPDEAVPYLMSQYRANKKTQNAQKELAKKVSNDAATIVKKKNKAQFKGYHTFR